MAGCTTGEQDFWLVGTKIVFRQESDCDGENYPPLDLGTVTDYEATVEPESSILEDPGCGELQIVDEKASKVQESWNLTLRNFNPDVLRFLFMSGKPESWEQLATPATEVALDATAIFPGHIIEGLKADGNRIYNIDTVEAIRSAKVALGGGTIGAGGTFVVTGADVTELFPAGTTFNSTDDGTESDAVYTVDTAVFAVGDTTITVIGTETIPAGQVFDGNIARIYVLGTDWEVYNLDQGILKAIYGGGIAKGASLVWDYTPTAVAEGGRLLNPQSAPLVKGWVDIFLQRNSCNDITVRRARVSVKPSGSTLTATEHSSYQVTITVLTTAGDAGSLTWIKGVAPAST